LSDILLLTFAGALVGLDHLSLKTMISRPIVVAPVLGLIFGEERLGLLAGAWLELMWIDKVPMGNYVPPAASYLAVIAVGSMILAGGKGEHAHLTFVLTIFLLLPVAYLGKGLDTWIFTCNEVSARRAELAAKEGKEKKVEREHLLAIARGLIISTLFMVTMSILGAFALRFLLKHSAPWALRVADFVFYFFPPVLLGGALHGAWGRGEGKLFIMAGILGGLVCLLVYGLDL